MSTVNLDVDTFAPWERWTMPNGSIVYYRESDHAYSTEIHKANGKWSYVQGSRIAGVSTVVKPLSYEPDSLMHWAAKLTEEGRDWRAVRNGRAEVGTNVHEHALAALATGKPLPSFGAMTEEERGYARGVLAFWHDYEPVTELSEQVVYSATHGVAGRPDWVGHIVLSGSPVCVLLDLKTSESKFTPAKHHGQVKLYDICLDDCGFGATDEQWVLTVRPDGTYDEPMPCCATNEDALAGLAAYRAAQRINATMTGRRRAREAA